MSVIGNPRSFHKKLKFLFEPDDVGHAGFQKRSELSVEVANAQCFEGGALIPNQGPGRITFSDVTIERGATEDRDLFDWFQDVAISSSRLGLTDASDKRNLDVVKPDRDGVTLRRWPLSREWPASGTTRATRSSLSRSRSRTTSSSSCSERWPLPPRQAEPRATSPSWPT